MNVIDMFRKLRGERRETATKAYWRLIVEQVRAPQDAKSADLQKTASVLDELAAGLGFTEDDVAKHLEMASELRQLGDNEAISREIQLENTKAHAAIEAEQKRWNALAEQHEKLGEELAAALNQCSGRAMENSRRAERSSRICAELAAAGAPGTLRGEVTR